MRFVMESTQARQGLLACPLNGGHMSAFWLVILTVVVLRPTLLKVSSSVAAESLSPTDRSRS
jgi:hypothetical protein